MSRGPVGQSSVTRGDVVLLRFLTRKSRSPAESSAHAPKAPDLSEVHPNPDEWLAAVLARTPSGPGEGQEQPNGHGAPREMPGDAVFKVGAQPHPAELAAAISVVLTDEALRERLVAGAHEYCLDVSFDKIAERFWHEVVLAS